MISEVNFSFDFILCSKCSDSMFCFCSWTGQQQLGSRTPWRYFSCHGRSHRGQIRCGWWEEADDRPDPLDPRPHSTSDTGRTQLSRCWFASDFVSLSISLSISLLTYPAFIFLCFTLIRKSLTVSTLIGFTIGFYLIFDRVCFPPRPLTTTVLQSIYSISTHTQNKQTNTQI